MRAVGLRRFGGPEVLEIVELPEPRPGPGEVRVRVSAATVNPADTLVRSGLRTDVLSEATTPYVLGMELAGVVDAVGPGVDLAPGTQVMAATTPAPEGSGAYAELVVVPAASVALVPPGMDLVAAATLPMNGLTARLALDRVHPAPGETVAVTGAAGALGGYLVELAAAEGLRVLADASPADDALVRGLGADVVVPRGDDVAAAIREVVPEGVAAMFDCSLQRGQLLRAIRDGGTIAAFRTWTGDTERDITVEPIAVRDYLREGTKLQALADQAAAGTLTLRVARTYPAALAGEAHRRLEAGGTRGRLVLTF